MQAEDQGSSQAGIPEGVPARVPEALPSGKKGPHGVCWCGAKAYTTRAYKCLEHFIGSKPASVEYAVHNAIKRGVIPPAKACVCVDCGKPARHYDHRDYNKPLEVEPVCISCNMMRGAAIPYKHDA